MRSSMRKGLLNYLFALSLLAVFGVKSCQAQIWIKDPTNWWPDPSTGLMWAEHGRVGSIHGLKVVGLNWDQANEYCSDLRLGGFSGWRIPTLDEVKGIAFTRHIEGYMDTITEADGTEIPNYIKPFDEQDIKVGEWNGYFPDFVWTSTPSPYADKSAWIVGPFLTLATVLKTEVDRDEGRFIFKSSDALSALCVRPMEPEILAIAKDAEVSTPVPNLQVLKANVPLTKARLAYKAGQYQESITDAQDAIAMQPTLITAYWGIGICYGRLGKWDLAIAQLNSAFKMDKNYDGDVYSSLRWAKAGKSAAKKGQAPKIKGKDWPPPVWNGPPWE